MRRIALRSTVALLTFACGVLVVAVRNELRFHESFWNFYKSSATTSDSGSRKCSEAWDDAVSQSLGWDLTYSSVITRMKVCPGAALCEQWSKPAPPIQKHISEWQGDPIVASFEIELPDGHASMSALWFIRTRDQAYYWGFYPLDTDYSGGKHVIPTETYDAVFEKMACWQPVQPQKQTFGADGYIGFVSMYKEGKSRQMFLPYQDFIERGNDPNYRDVQPGAFMKMLQPLSALEKNSNPTSEEDTARKKSP